jgi:hypothetical protein
MKNLRQYKRKWLFDELDGGFDDMHDELDEDICIGLYIYIIDYGKYTVCIN